MNICINDLINAVQVHIVNLNSKNKKMEDYPGLQEAKLSPETSFPFVISPS